MFALFPLPPTAHQTQLRRHREEFGQDPEAARQRHVGGQVAAPTLQPEAPAFAAGLRWTVAAALIRAGERLQGAYPARRVALGSEATAEPGTASQ